MSETEIKGAYGPGDEPYDAPRHSGYWLPENYALWLTSLELGWLVGKMYELKEGPLGEVYEPGEDGNPTPSTFSRVILKKLNKLVEQVYEESR